MTRSRRWPAITIKLFFYGTLIAGGTNATAREAHRHLGPGVSARARGALYAIPDPLGWYPALVMGAAGVVHGMVYEAPVDFCFAALDAYEGSDYVRAPIPVVAAGQPVMAQAYLWAGPLPDGAQAIDHGDFARWLGERGARAYSA